MKRALAVFTIAILAVLTIGAQLEFRGSSVLTSAASGTYTDSQVDTLTWVRSGNETGATFWIACKDSLCLDNVILRRQFRGILAAVIVGDTIIAATTADSAIIQYGSITLPPYTDTLKIFVNYADSSNGVTSPTVQYGIGKKF